MGTKYDIYTTMPQEEIEEIDKLARKFSKVEAYIYVGALYVCIISSVDNIVNLQGYIHAFIYTCTKYIPGTHVTTHIHTFHIRQ